MIWRSDEDPFQLVFVAHLRSLKGLAAAIHHALRHLPESDLRAVLFHDKDIPAWDISRQIQDGLGLKIDRISRTNRMLRLASSMVSGAGTYAHLVESTWRRRSSPSTQGPLRGVVHLLAPGAPPSGVFVDWAPEQRSLSVLTCESKDMPMYVELLGLSDEVGLVVNGPDVSKTKRVVFPGLLGWGVWVGGSGGVFWWCVREGCSGGVFGWGVRVGCSGGVFRWGVRVGCSGGVLGFGWGVRVGCPGGVFGWGVRVGCSGGVSGWGVRVGCSGGVFGWGVRLGCLGGVFG